MVIKNRKWFSVIISVMITAFLIVVSSWILLLVVQESKNTRLVYNSISTYAWAIWAQEYALLKVKNHKEWFADKVEFSIDYDSKLLWLDSDKITRKDALLSYEINNNSKLFSWTINSWEFEIIPLYFDIWEKISSNSLNPELNTSSIIKTKSLKLIWDNNFVWNIIWNDWSWTTFWMVGTWVANSSIWAWYSVSQDNWSMKTISEDSLVFENSKTINLENIKIADFLEKYDDNYLIIYNISKNTINYSLESNEGFALPKLEIVSSSKIDKYKQNISFTEDKWKYLNILKYSIFNK